MSVKNTDMTFGKYGRVVKRRIKSINRLLEQHESYTLEIHIIRAPPPCECDFRWPRDNFHLARKHIVKFVKLLVFSFRWQRVFLALILSFIHLFDSEILFGIQKFRDV